MGLPVPLLTDGRAGVRYHWLAGDLRRAVAERRRGLLLDVGHSLGYGIGARHSILRLDDPGPAAHLLTGRWPADRLGWTARQPRRRTSRSTSPATRRSGARSTASASW